MTDSPTSAEALRRLADAATEGPWERTGRNGIHTPIGSCVALTHRHDPEQRQDDAEFIAAARGAVPALLDENAALRARIKAVQDVLEESEARGPVGMTFNGTPFPAWVSIATVRRALTA